jgi:hypothetical protein
MTRSGQRAVSPPDPAGIGCRIPPAIPAFLNLLPSTQDREVRGPRPRPVDARPIGIRGKDPQQHPETQTGLSCGRIVVSAAVEAGPHGDAEVW